MRDALAEAAGAVPDEREEVLGGPRPALNQLGVLRKLVGEGIEGRVPVGGGLAVGEDHHSLNSSRTGLDGVGGEEAVRVDGGQAPGEGAGHMIQGRVISQGEAEAVDVLWVYGVGQHEGLLGVRSGNPGVAGWMSLFIHFLNRHILPHQGVIGATQRSGAAIVFKHLGTLAQILLGRNGLLWFR